MSVNCKMGRLSWRFEVDWTSHGRSGSELSHPLGGRRGTPLPETARTVLGLEAAGAGGQARPGSEGSHSGRGAISLHKECLPMARWGPCCGGSTRGSRIQ